MASAGKPQPPVRLPRRGVLIIVENLPVPFDRRVWSAARTLREAGYQVSVICPKGALAAKQYEYLEGVHIYRHPLPLEARNGPAFLLEYASALLYEFILSIRVLCRHGFDVIHACNPPDTIFLIGGFLAGSFFELLYIFEQQKLAIQRPALMDSEPVLFFEMIKTATSLFLSPYLLPLSYLRLQS